MKNKTNNKITHDVRKQIAELCTSLPPVPFFMEGKNGMIVQQITQGKRISASSLPKEEIERIGTSLSGMYTQRTKVARMMNHKVNLNTQYTIGGQHGIVAYCAYVKQIEAMIAQASQPKASLKESPAEISAPVSDEAMVVLDESGPFPDIKLPVSE